MLVQRQGRPASRRSRRNCGRWPVRGRQ